ncbi:MAG: Eco57I restriction-modification methylase domain-containing protein, partial [Promethearchaeota archaeon]
DPACGTGSFLVALYSCLNKEYQKRSASNFNYNPVNDPLENIYGIDISEDGTFLCSLALILYHNILNKNSQEADLENSSKSILFSKKLQIFTGDALFLDWSEIFTTKPGSFTAVVGNPPFVQYLNLENTYRRKLTTSDFQFQYQRWDLYVLFIEKSLGFLKKKGFLTFIIPDSFLDEQYAKHLRCYLTENFQIRKVIDLRGHKVFLGATVGTVVLQLVNSPPSNNLVLIGEPQVNYHSNQPIIFDYFTTSQNNFKKSGEYKWRLIPSEYWQFFEEINKNSFPLHEICYVTNGFQISPISSFQSNESETVDGISSRAFLKGEQIQSYYIASNQHSWFLYSNEKSFYFKLKRPFSSDPKSWKPKFPELFENPKIVIPRVAGNSIRASFDNKGYYCWQTIVCLLPKHYITNVPKKKLGRSCPSLTEEQIAKSKNYDLRYLLGIINSKITRFYFTTFLGNGLDILKSNIEQFRIPSATERDQRNVISVVKILESLNQKFYENPQDIDIYQTQKIINKLQNELDSKILTLFNISTPPWEKN